MDECMASREATRHKPRNFDALMRAPARPAFLRTDVDNDGPHPSLAGYRVMTEALPVEVLDRRCPQVGAP